MPRPSFQFYPADWRSNAKLRRCSTAARGAWMDILCVLNDSDEYGACRWPLADLARAAGVRLKLAQELADKDVLKGANEGHSGFIWRPFHAGKHGNEITILENTNRGALWYSSRMVRDEYIRLNRGKNTQFTAENQPPKATPSRRVGERQGDGSSSSSSSSSSEVEEESYHPDSSVGPRSQKARASKPAENGHAPPPSKGSRWPADAVVPDDWIHAAGMKRAELGLPAIDLALAAEKFANYWSAKSGAAATKVNWFKTWINWCLNTENPRNVGKTTAHDNWISGASAALAERAAARRKPDA